MHCPMMREKRVPMFSSSFFCAPRRWRCPASIYPFPSWLLWILVGPLACSCLVSPYWWEHAWCRLRGNIPAPHICRSSWSTPCTCLTCIRLHSLSIPRQVTWLHWKILIWGWILGWMCLCWHFHAKSFYRVHRHRIILKWLAIYCLRLMWQGAHPPSWPLVWCLSFRSIKILIILSLLPSRFVCAHMGGSWQEGEKC